jgi:hypothetical protein
METQIHDLKWKRYVNQDLCDSKFWWGAQKSSSIQLDDPDIVALSSARIRRLTKKGEPWIEIIIENLSNRIASSAELDLSAAHMTLNVCPSSVEVPNWQSVNLDWSSILAKNTIDKPSGVWTVIKEEGVVARNYYSESCSSFNFKTTIPIQVDIEPQTKMRLSLKIVESSNTPATLKQESSKSFFEPRLHPPSSLYEWDSLHVSIHDDELVFPKIIDDVAK